MVMTVQSTDERLRHGVSAPLFPRNSFSRLAAAGALRMQSPICRLAHGKWQVDIMHFSIKNAAPLGGGNDETRRKLEFHCVVAQNIAR